MSTRVRCTLNYGGMRYSTTHQVVQTVIGLYRQYTGKYYLVKRGTTPMWKYLVEMVERIPDWPEGAKLRIWREKRGGKKRRIEAVLQRAATTIALPGGTRFIPAPEPRGRFRNGAFVPNTGWQEAAGQEAPRAER